MAQLQTLEHTNVHDLPERRVAARIVTVCRLVKLRTRHGEAIARCRNMSNGGVKLETHMPVRLRERVTVCFSTDVEIEGTFAWVDGTDSGVTFDKPIDCIAVLRETAPSNPGTRPPRLQTALPVSVSYSGGKCGSLCRDISLQGMKVTHDGSLHSGLNVTVMLADGLERRAMVCWTRDEFAGLQLLDRFRLEDLHPLLAAA